MYNFRLSRYLSDGKPSFLNPAFESLKAVKKVLDNKKKQNLIILIITVIIIITRPKPAYGRQGLAGSWGQDTDKVSTFWVFLTSHFAPAALSSELNQPGTIHDDTNPPGIMKTRPGAIKKT